MQQTGKSMNLRGLMGAGLALCLLCVVQIANAHEIRPTIFTLVSGSGQTTTLTADANLEALIAQVGPEHEDTDTSPYAQIYNQLRALPPEELEIAFREFAPGWLATLGLTADGQAVPLSLQDVLIPKIGDTDLARQSTVTIVAELPADAEALTWAYPAQYGASVLRIERPDEEVDARFFQAGAVSDPIAFAFARPQGTLEVFVDYIVIGFDHILPKGLDHILFVLGLFLLNQHWKPLLWQVTAFTIAHSITLALGLYGVVSISPSIVEPLIALSIVYVAVENLMTSKLHIWRPVIVFAFGLLHGLGFAGVLTEIGLAPQHYATGLIAFNIGVELGQIAVIAIAFASVALFMDKSWYRKGIVWPASIAIALMGAWWFVERTIL